MATAARRRREPTDDWQQLRLLVDLPAQATYELLRPVVLAGAGERTLGQVARLADACNVGAGRAGVMPSARAAAAPRPARSSPYPRPDGRSC